MKVAILLLALLVTSTTVQAQDHIDLYADQAMTQWVLSPPSLPPGAV